MGEIAAHQRLDIVVDDCVVVEIKASEQQPPIAERQLYNYLRCTSLALGLLLHFGAEPTFRRLVDTGTHKHARLRAEGSSSGPRSPVSATSASPMQSNANDRYDPDAQTESNLTRPNDSEAQTESNSTVQYDSGAYTKL
jgi:hypothetical protein